MSIYEADGLEGLLGGFKIGAANQNIHILGVSHGSFINAGNPHGDSIATDDRIWDAFSVQRAC